MKSKDRLYQSFKKTTALVILVSVAVVVGVFSLGVLVGDGQISFPGVGAPNGNLPSSLNYSSVNQVYDLLKNNYYEKLTTDQLLDGLKSGLAQSTGDQYTEYFNPSQAQQLNNELNETFSGVGAEIGQNSSGNIIIIAPIAGFPAAKAGLQSQDIISSINGVSTTGMTSDQAVTAIRGPQGTKVTLGIVRGNNLHLTYTITRSNITLPSVNTSILSGNIGYLQISQFTNDTATLATQAAQQFKKANVKGIILDLRDNPGGLVDAAVSVSSLWLPQGKMILQEKRGSTVLMTYTSDGNDIVNGIPTVVLIDAGTASASEITTGALHDNGAAYVIGVKSFGKGVVQQIFNLSGGSELKVTIASWYRPDGQNINKLGITPDQTVAETSSNTANNQDPQKNAAITWIQQH